MKPSLRLAFAALLPMLVVPACSSVEVPTAGPAPSASASATSSRELAQPKASRSTQRAQSQVRLRAVRQRAGLALLPPIAQKGPRAQAARRASVVGTARFKPARPGRRVVIQRRVGGGWRKHVSTRQRRGGVVRFKGPARRAGRPYAYRAVALKHRGIRRVSTPQRRSNAWKLHFNDEFSGRKLNSSKWSYRALGERQSSSGRSTAESSRRSVAVKKGTLRLSVRRMPGESGVYRNGHIGSQGKYAFRYGIAAARIKFPRGQGQHGSFWLQPESASPVPGKPGRSGAEIDVVEFFGKGYRDGGLGHFIWWLGKNREQIKHGDVRPNATKMLGKRDAWWKNYHVFSVEWTPRKYIFRVDGKKTWRTTRGVSRVREYLILSLLTSEWELPRLNRRSLPTKMSVDWARVWKS